MKPLIDPSVFYSRSAVLSKPSPVPTERGLYAWFFKEIPGITPTDGCVVKDDLARTVANGTKLGRKSVLTSSMKKRIVDAREEGKRIPPN